MQSIFKAKKRLNIKVIDNWHKSKKNPFWLGYYARKDFFLWMKDWSKLPKKGSYFTMI